MSDEVPGLREASDAGLNAGGEVGTSSPASSRLPDPAPENEKGYALTRVSDLIEGALKGTLPRDRDPHYWEPQILGSRHINMVLDRAGGYQLTEIADRWDYTPAQVANVLSHPDAQTILGTIAALQANTLVSIEQRFAALAPEALNLKVELMRNEGIAPIVRDRIATDILDRAGYAPREKKEVLHAHKILLPAQAATGLREVLEESKRVRTVDYSAFLMKPDGEVAASHLQVGSGQPPVDGAPPIPPDEEEAA